MARLHPACSLIQLRGQRGESAAWSSIRQHLQHHCTSGEEPADSDPDYHCSDPCLTVDAGAAASWRQVERFCHQSVFESMPLTSLDQDGVLQRGSSSCGSPGPARQQQEAAVLPWDDPPSFASLQLKNQQTPGRHRGDGFLAELGLFSSLRVCASRSDGCS